MTALTEYENVVSSAAANTRASKKTFDMGGRNSPSLLSRDLKSNFSRKNAKYASRDSSLGFLYQNKNKVLSIGDIKGVKGNPNENISKKGVFEQKVPF
jgi:hypothetical protein